MGGGGSSPAQALPLGPAMIQKVPSAPARSNFDPMRDGKGSLCWGKRSLLRPCCDPGAVARDTVEGIEGQYLHQCPASLGAHLDQGFQAPP